MSVDCYKLTLDAAVAGARCLLLICDGLLLVGESSRNVLGLCGLDLGWDALRGAVDNVAVLNKTLDHPMAVSRAVNAGVHTSRAEIVVSVVTDAAVEVLVIHWVVAIVAVYDPGGACNRFGTECKRGVRSLGGLVKEGCEEGQYTIEFHLV